MKINASHLTRCLVDDDGQRISLRLVDQNGEPFELALSAQDASEIAATLPQMLRASFDERARDSRVRSALPLNGWALEATPDGAQIIMTLTAESGLEFSFATEPAACASLGSALTSRRC